MQTYKYMLGKTQITYLVTDKGRTSFVMLPADEAGKLAVNWDSEPAAADAANEYNKEWKPGSLVHLHLRHHKQSCLLYTSIRRQR